ncbi:EthD family reductase [Chitinophaga pinensis]|uniref:Ethyl tert-butyl ether degradation EthD n=1 Tax=Chitinophaga pinensis (strain ATCC 43595 / DSM 2588 / LMG 13176 / NBRC 15968 / NCIMB 11800 / UQM 2034) TaxID=485918 RepID=A0A979GXN9_CHIPD|nr:EthD family reductase [Chitinophaga pinensis]ACU62571.1 Ethyl tert-butyl ether degradation EthD [Chitinophaga pinensis DSM 2588]
MKCQLILSLLLLTTCFVGFGQEKGAGKSKKQNADVVEKGLTKISILYPYAEGKTFDMVYYEAKHMPMVASYLGSNLVKYTIEKGLSGGAPDQPLLYMAVGAFYVKSLSEYQAAIKPNLDAIRADFANYTNVLPVVLVSEVVK